jgi:hypothetical protein
MIELIYKIHIDLLKNGFKLNLIPKDFIASSDCDGLPCRGYFDEETKELAVAIGSGAGRWWYTLCHEYGHFKQWQEKLWTTSNSFSDFSEWIDGSREFSKKHIEKMIRDIQECERDAERRGLKLIKKYKLPDVKDYIQRANAYILFYEVIRKHRKWCKPGCSPSLINEVFGLVSNKLIVKDLSALPVGFEDAVLRHCL